jgi:protein associated with RNAse G/E
MPPRDPQPASAGASTRQIRILSTKYDGSLHNDFAGQLLEDPTEEPDTPLRVFVPQGTPIQSYRGALTVRIPFTALFWPDADRWWNVYHNHWTIYFDGRWSSASYANVASPATFDGETLRWVDLDLDVVIREGAVELLDEDEFEEHRALMAYPEAIVTGALEAAAALIDLATRRVPPFNRDAHIWVPRP